LSSLVKSSSRMIGSALAVNSGNSFEMSLGGPRRAVAAI
jgi:hypothetical protein